ncbi:MAG: hypothetical protein CXT71_05835 [Methanobacteriota archaeon]|jgi:hypothetical protein|nr:MAG: hypothetical protein CXT71_05835 [Euryarchaeota archaeon]
MILIVFFINPINLAPTMAKGWLLLFAVLCFSLPQVSPLLNNVAAAGENYEAGYTEWDLKNAHRIYISGDGTDINLTRDYQGRSEGNIGISFNQQLNLGPLSLPPLENSFNGTFNVSTFVAAYLAGGTNSIACKIPVQQRLTVTTTISIGGVNIFTGEYSDVVDENSASAINFSAPEQMVEINASRGDVISMTIQAQHNCANEITLGWGGSKGLSGGIVIKGELFTPVFNIVMDDSDLVHIEFEPIFPWGFNDLEFLSMDVFGPIPKDELRVYDGDFKSESFTSSSGYLLRTDEDGTQSRVYTGVNSLPTGDNVLIICMKTSDSQNMVTPCDNKGLIRFNVEGEDSPIADASFWLSISGFIAIIAYLIALIRQGIFLPLPLIGALVVMALLMIPLAGSIPDMGGENIVEKDARAEDFSMPSQFNNSVSLSDLLDGKEAVIIGISLPASTNSLDHFNQLDNAKSKLGNRVSIAQVLTGDGANIDDLFEFQNNVNATWPILLDDGGFADGLPDGTSDSIVIIDRLGRVTFSDTGSASSDDLVRAVDEISDGGQQSPSNIFSLFWGPGLAMLLVALPRKKYEAPAEAVPPGSLWGSIAIAGGIGFLAVNVFSMVIELLPVGNEMKSMADIALVIWFVTAAIRAAIVGTPKEVTLLAKGLHRLYPKNFSQWREFEDVERDVLIGFWMGWFIWLANPALLAQGVASVFIIGGFNYIYAFILLAIYVLAAGLLTLTIRVIATWGGPLSHAFGSFGGGPFAEALGWALIPISLWVLVDMALDLISLGLGW